MKNSPEFTQGAVEAATIFLLVGAGKLSDEEAEEKLADLLEVSLEEFAKQMGVEV
jgi:hypothetical protein